jgi:hypothetical protein
LDTAVVELDEQEAVSAKAVIERMRREAERSGVTERRSAERSPFFAPAQIELADGQCRAAFTRDVSTPGIGLVHRQSIEPGEITLRFAVPDGMLTQRTRIIWCREVGDGWYASGGRFVDPLAP